MVDLTQQLKAQALALGFNMVGIVPARPARRLAAYLRWIAQGMHGYMGYMARPDRVARRRDLQLILPQVQTIVCVGLDYYTQPVPEQIARDPSRGRLSNYAWGVDYHEVMTPRLQELGRWLTQTAVQWGVTAEVQHKVYVDTGAILERDHAETAGLGFTGKNSMLIAPRAGSWFFLGELLTTLPLTADELRQSLPTCGHCTRCLTACPTQAFPQPYVLDARRCISYLTIELKGWIPRELRSLMGNWVYGCDICQEVCPFNRFALERENVFFQGQGWETAVPSLLTLLSLTPSDFQSRYQRSPVKRLGWARFMRNVCVAAGNWGDEAAVPFLEQLLASSEPLVRGHAAWALGQNAANTTRSLTQHQESEAVVREEITHALRVQQKKSGSLKTPTRS